MRAVFLDERVRVHGQARELLVEVPENPSEAPTSSAHGGGNSRKWFDLFRITRSRSRTSSPLYEQCPPGFWSSEGGASPPRTPRRCRCPRRPEDPRRARPARARAAAQEAARLAVLHLDAVRDVAQELELRGVRPPERVRERLRGGRAICGVGLRQGAHEVRGFPRHALQLFELGIDASGDVRVAFVARAEGVAAARQAVVRQAAQAERVHGAALPPASQALGREAARGPAAVGVARRARRSVGARAEEQASSRSWCPPPRSASWRGPCPRACLAAAASPARSAASGRGARRPPRAAR